MRLDIRAEDVAAAVRNNCENCPLAIGLRRALLDRGDDVVFVVVGYQSGTAMLGDGSASEWTWETEVAARVVKYDHGGEWEPGAVEVRPRRRRKR